MNGSSRAFCTSSITLGALADGAHTFSVLATDNAGNTSMPATYTWLIDTVAPTESPTQSLRPNAAGWNRPDAGWDRRRQLN